MNRNGTESVRTVARDLNAQLATQVRERPYVTIGFAAGAGFVAGSVLGSRIAQLGVAIAAGYLAREMMEGSEVAGELKRLIDQALERFGGRKRGASARAAS
jgi:DUF883 C-terminal glycine zipper region